MFKIVIREMQVCSMFLLKWLKSKRLTYISGYYILINYLWRIVFLKLNVYLPYDPAILFLGIFPREM